MHEILDTVTSNIIPIISVFIALATLWLNRKPARDQIFEYRKKISDFAFDSYTKFGDEKFKKISYEYAIAALTKDNNLTTEQRDTLLSLKNPVFELEHFSKCQRLIDVQKNSLTWKNVFYKSRVYRWILKSLCFITYLLGGFICATPFMYDVYFSEKTLAHFSKLSPWYKVGSLSFIIATGFLIMVPALAKGSSITLAEKIVKNQRNLNN
ncbi:hypothetical protein [Rosenbergiella epipactidis]|uniref:hypothetical protein n=1 Tax=Rosenbergiella epipactidis TaxID=1544694 RepID=UPI001F4E045C|nr:hypothetical protein [Rosenbergiella epipactidis]